MDRFCDCGAPAANANEVLCQSALELIQDKEAQASYDGKGNFYLDDDVCGGIWDD